MKEIFVTQLRRCAGIVQPIMALFCVQHSVIWGNIPFLQEGLPNESTWRHVCLNNTLPGIQHHQTSTQYASLVEEIYHQTLPQKRKRLNKYDQYPSSTVFATFLRSSEQFPFLLPSFPPSFLLSFPPSFLLQEARTVFFPYASWRKNDSKEKPRTKNEHLLFFFLVTRLYCGKAEAAAPRGCALLFILIEHHPQHWLTPISRVWRSWTQLDA